MALLPAENKYLIQTSYVRYRELAKEIPELDKKITIGKIVQWGGLAVLISSLFNLDWPNFIGGAGLAGFVFGWPITADLRKKYSDLIDEKYEILKKMESVKVFLTDGYSGVTVYAGSIDDGNEVRPLNDSDYK